MVTAAPHCHTGVVGALNAEWATLCASPTSTDTARGWGLHAHSPLSEADDLTQVAALVADPRTSDAALTQLLRLAQQGDRLAARTALQTLLGVAVGLARRTVHHADWDHEESRSRAVAAVWDVIHSYPLERRRCRPLDGLSLDVLSALTDQRLSRAPGWLLGDTPDEVVEALERTSPAHTRRLSDRSPIRESFWSSADLATPEECGDEQLILVLAWAVREDVLNRAEALLLLELHSPAAPGGRVAFEDAAARRGVSGAALRQRASRATRRLATAVQERAAAPHTATGSPIAA